MSCDQDRSLWSYLRDHSLRGQRSGERACVRRCHAREALQSHACLEGFDYIPSSWRVTDLRNPRKKILRQPLFFFFNSFEAWGVVGRSRKQSLLHCSSFLRGIPTRSSAECSPPEGIWPTIAGPSGDPALSQPPNSSLLGSWRHTASSGNIWRAPGRELQHWKAWGRGGGGARAPGRGFVTAHLLASQSCSVPPTTPASLPCQQSPCLAEVGAEPVLLMEELHVFRVRHCHGAHRQPLPKGRSSHLLVATFLIHTAE